MRRVSGLARDARPIGGPALAVLRRIVRGAHCTGARAFPFPFSYQVGVSDVPATVIASLVEARLLTAHCSDLAVDHLWFSVTEAGRQLVSSGPPGADAVQIDLLGDAGGE